MTNELIIALLGTVGAGLSAFIGFLTGRRKNNSEADKISAESELVRAELESKYATQHSRLFDELVRLQGSQSANAWNY